MAVSRSGRYYDDADHDLEMMPVAVPQRGRRSQHGSGRRHRPELDFPPPPPTPTSPLTKHAPAAGPGAGSSADPASAMESGFFNKYAVDDNSGQRGGAENDSTENETGVRPGGPGTSISLIIWRFVTCCRTPLHYTSIKLRLTSFSCFFLDRAGLPFFPEAATNAANLIFLI